MSGDTDRFAIRVTVGAGTLGGGLLGLLFAPRIQWRLSPFGVNPTAFGPALAIIVLAAIVGGLIAWKAAQRAP